MSQPFEYPEAGADHLQRAIRSLPAHEPPPDTWPRVAAQLAADAALAQAVPTLPAHEPDDALWAAIAARLTTDELPAAPLAGPVVRTLKPGWLARPVRRALALAASVLLVLGVWWGQRAAQPASAALHETVAYSEEISTEVAATPEPLPAPAFDPLERQSLAFIDGRCTAQPVVCSSGEFRSLRTQLAELEAQQARLQQDARRFGESPGLLREQARLITLKASITRELVHLLIS